MLYDGALRFLSDAERSFASGDLAARAHAISRALAIVNELQSTLDLGKGGDLAAELDRLYDFVQDRLLSATRDRDAGAVADAKRVLNALAEGWRALAANGGKAAAC